MLNFTVSIMMNSPSGPRAAQNRNETMLPEPGDQAELESMNQAHADLVRKEIQPIMRPGVTAPILLPGIVDADKVKLLHTVLEHRLQHPPKEQVIRRVLREFLVVSRFEQV